MRLPGAVARGGGSGGRRSPSRSASAVPPVPAQVQKASCREDPVVSSAPDRAAAGQALQADSGAAAAGAGLRTSDAPRSPHCLPLAPTAI